MIPELSRPTSLKADRPRDFRGYGYILKN